MQINNLFAKDIQRSIEGVIKADDTKQLGVEVDEYVLTAEAARAVDELLDRYNNNDGSNGVWISGFFGSGKSHLLKMLAHLLGTVPQHDFDRSIAVDAFRQKAREAEELTLEGAISRSSQIPAMSILFNIDQKASAATVKNDDSLLAAFVRVFDEACGYYGRMPHIAQFERDLDSRGELEEFKNIYAEVSGRSWEDGRSLSFLEEHNAAVAYARLKGTPETQPVQILAQYSDNYSITAEDFAQNVKDWLDRQEDPRYRINFFADEVGQFIANNVKLMLKLQTVAETLMTVCGGRSWVFVTSQESMDSVLGDRTKQQANDFSKIQARFKARLKLSSQDVEEVISKRLLRKNGEGAAEVGALYARQQQNLKTLFDFHDGSRAYGNYKNEDHFIAIYPFAGYQFRLFQNAIEGLSQQNAFEGRYSSVGERSMLGVVQDVAKQIADEAVGTTVSFDRMFEGIKNALKSSIVRQIAASEQELDTFAAQVLKALFLVKYVDEFKASEHNIVVLMYPGFDSDISTLQSKVKHALRELEQRSFIQRTGELFEYLTDAEKDIEQKIKNIDLEPGDERRVYQEHIAAILSGAKIRDAVTNRDFSYTLKIDDTAAGRGQELSINFLTPLYDFYDDVAVLRAHSMGKDELRVVLRPDERLMSDIRLYVKTNKYVKRTQGSSTSEDATRALNMKTQVNQMRARQFKSRIEEAILNAVLIDNGSELEGMSAPSAKARIELAFSKLTGRVYSELGQLGDSKMNETTIRSILSAEETVEGTDSQRSMAVAAQTMLGEITRRHTMGETLNVARMVNHFEKSPYGWDSLSSRAVLALLVHESKVTVSKDSRALRRSQVSEVLTRGTGFDQLWLGVPKQISEKKVRLVRDFLGDLEPLENMPVFDGGEDLAEYALVRIKTVLGEVKRLSLEPYPFVSLLGPLTAKLGELSQYSSAPTALYEQDEALDFVLDQVDSVLAPVRGFMAGQQRSHYDQAVRFLDAEKANLASVPSVAVAKLRDVLTAERCFESKNIQSIRQLQGELSEQILLAKQEARTEAFDTLEQGKKKIEALPEWQQAPAQLQEEIENEFQKAREQISDQGLIPYIGSSAQGFRQNTVPVLVHKLIKAVQAQRETAEPETALEGATSAVEGSSVAVAADSQPSVSRPVQIADLMRPSGSPSVLRDSADLDRYLALLKRDLEQALADDKYIMLF